MNKQSSAARYRAIAAQRRAESTVETFEVEAPSGMVFVVREPDYEILLLAGALPLGLAEKMVLAQKEGKSESGAVQSLSIKDQIKGIEFSAALVRHICVNPKIVDNPENDDEISPADLLLEDYKFLLDWANSGGQSSLDSFRDERSKLAVGSNGSGKVQRVAK